MDVREEVVTVDMAELRKRLRDQIAFRLLDLANYDDTNGAWTDADKLLDHAFPAIDAEMTRLRERVAELEDTEQFVETYRQERNAAEARLAAATTVTERDIDCVLLAPWRERIVFKDRGEGLRRYIRAALLAFVASKQAGGGEKEIAAPAPRQEPQI